MGTVRRGAQWPETVVALAAASGICVGLVVLRISLTGEPYYAFLVWNLALAWMPLLLAVAVWLGVAWGLPRTLLAAAGVLWLLFLPNAPYIVTDYIHLQFHYGGAPLWFDALAITAYAATGLLLGFASIYLMQAVAENLLSRTTTWLLVLATLGLSSVGIYLGRYQRLNSWDAIRHPDHILGMIEARLREPLGNEALIAVTVCFTFSLAALYLVLYAWVLPRVDLRRSLQRDGERHYGLRR